LDVVKDTKRGSEMNEEISLEGPVQLVDEKLVLLIPLEEGGSEFLECTRGIGEVHGKYLKIVLQPWLAGLLRIDVGDRVVVSNEGGKFGIHALQPRSVN
jgi:hypothetical protein